MNLSCFYKQDLALSILICMDYIQRKYKEEINYSLFRSLNTFSVCGIVVFAM